MGCQQCELGRLQKVRPWGAGAVRRCQRISIIRHGLWTGLLRVAGLRCRFEGEVLARGRQPDSAFAPFPGVGADHFRTGRDSPPTATMGKRLVKGRRPPGAVASLERTRRPLPTIAAVTASTKARNIPPADNFSTGTVNSSGAARALAAQPTDHPGDLKGLSGVRVRRGITRYVAFVADVRQPGRVQCADSIRDVNSAPCLPCSAHGYEAQSTPENCRPC